MTLRRKNLVISVTGPDALLLPCPKIQGNTLQFDAKLGSFLPQINPLSAINLGNGEPVLENFLANVLKFNTLKEGNNVQISEIGGEITISADQFVTGTTPTIIVNDIPARDTLVPGIAPGIMVFVKDTGQGENAMYIWTGLSFATISTQDSAAADAQTLVIEITHTSAPVNLIGRVSPGSRITNATVKVLEPFNGVDPFITIGDDINGTDIHMPKILNDLFVVDNYITASSFLYTGALETEVKAYFDPSGSNTGRAQILVSYV